jgi:hypothetical protein
VTIYFLKDIINKTKRGKSIYYTFNQRYIAFSGSEIQHLHCPQYETLSTKSILEWACAQSNLIQMYLPEEREIVKLPKQWILNVVYAILGEAFSTFIHERCQARNDKIIQERQMTINVDPEIAAAFNACNHVSSKYKYYALTFVKIL